MPITRLLRRAVATLLPMALAACQDRPADPGEPAAAPTTAAPPAGGADPGATLAPTPACDDGDDPTPSQTEGSAASRLNAATARHAAHT